MNGYLVLDVMSPHASFQSVLMAIHITCLPATEKHLRSEATTSAPHSCQGVEASTAWWSSTVCFEKKVTTSYFEDRLACPEERLCCMVINPTNLPIPRNSMNGVATVEACVGLPPSCIRCVYQAGSRVFGTHRDSSDW